MRGKRRNLDGISCFALYAKYRLAERLTVKETYKRIGDEMVVPWTTIEKRGLREAWEGKMTELMPVVAALVPTVTTSHEVISAQRQMYLSFSNKAAAVWQEGMDHLARQFRKYRDERNAPMADDYLRQMTAFMRFGILAQQMSGHATCDSGAAIAAQDAPSAQKSSNTYILLAKEIQNPRIPQPRPERTIDLRVQEE